MADSIIRVERRTNYTTIQNDMLRDRRLSLKAKGLFAVMLSTPDDWDFSVSGLAVINGVGKDAVRSALKELETAGYLVREQSHGERGKFSSNTYVLYEVSRSPLSGFPTTGNPLTDNPLSGNPTQIKKDLNKERLNKPPISPKAEKRKPGELPQEVRTLLNEFLADKPKLVEVMRQFVENRLELKKAKQTLGAYKAILARLDKYSGGNVEVMWDMLSAAAAGSWISVYAPKGEPKAPGGVAPPGRVIGDEEVEEW